MNKGFTLIETMVSMSLVMLAVLFSARIIIFALEQSRRAALRFRLVEKLDDYKNYLSSLSFAAPGLAAGEHKEESGEFQVSWRVQLVAPFLKSVRLTAATPQCALPLFFYKSYYFPEVSHD
ncbi:MAG TPA: prepilin-type N-terminal cleavage/methylation domain-containing protein [Acidobacteriota bacterium]